MVRTHRGLDLVARAGRRVPVGLLVLFVVVAAVPLAAQPLRWAPTGPRFGGISSLATAAGGQGVVWAAAAGQGVWRSLDSGASWVPAALAGARFYFAVAADPVDPLTVYAEGGEGLARTNDGGATWTVIHPEAVVAFAIAPSAPGTLYLASRGSRSQPPILSRSDDGGATWRALTQPGVQILRELDIDPADPEHVFALGAALVDYHSVFLVSADGGKSWRNGSVAPKVSISSLAIDPDTPGTLYGVLRQSKPVRSRDGGQTWEPINAGLPEFLNVSSLVFGRPGDLYLTATVFVPDLVTALGQVWWSPNGGASWFKLAERSGALYPLAFDHGSVGVSYLGTEDAGLLAVTGIQSSELMVASFVPPLVSSLTADSRLAGTLYATLDARPDTGPGSDYGPPPQLARTQDGGATWTSWTPRDQDGRALFLSGLIVADPFAAGALYFASDGVLHSADGGKTWRSTGSSFRFPDGSFFASSFAADPLHAGVFFAAGGETISAILRSADGGQSWTTVLNLVGTSVKALLVDPSSSGTVFAGGTDGFRRSLDGGQTWTGLGGPGLAKGQGIVRLQTDGGHNLYAEVSPAGPDLHTLYRSTDRGTTWSPIDAGLPAGTQVNDLLIDPRGPLYAGTGNGVFVSMDGGAHWTAASDGLASSNVLGLAAGSSQAGALVASTEDGLFVSPPSSCVPSDLVLCLAGGRFAARAHWTLPDGTSGDAHAAALTDRSGSFWFWSPQSVELTLKMIDGRTVNDHFWLFGADLTDVAYTLTVTEVATGAQRTYRNPGGHFGNFADTDAFAVSAASRAGESVAASEVSRPAPASRRAAAAPAETAMCTPGYNVLCLAGSRFAVSVSRQVSATSFTSAFALPLVQNTGAFWFFSPQLPELSVKVLDGRPVNGHFWVFLGGLSDVSYTVFVTDKATGARKEYVHPAGTFGSVADTSF